MKKKPIELERHLPMPLSNIITREQMADIEYSERLAGLVVVVVVGGVGGVAAATLGVAAGVLIVVFVCDASMRHRKPPALWLFLSLAVYLACKQS